MVAARRLTMRRLEDDHDEDLPDCDVVVEEGWSSGSGGSFPIIGAIANSEKGVAFLTAKHDQDDEDCEIGSAAFFPEELDSLKRQANLAGVSLVWRGPPPAA
jgi:hypothetical protein